MTNAMTETSPATTTDATAQRTPYAVSQIFHIFRKDTRHHWPEILVSLLLLSIYTWHSARQAGPAPYFVPGYPTTSALAIALAGVLPLLLVVAWFFLIFRVVQDESLIGDRQFWVTRPYRWPSLLAAKVLFVVAFVHFPLFVAQCFLLRQAGFPIIQNLGGLAAMHIPLALALLFPSAIAVLTRSVTHALIAALAALILFLAYGPALSEIPNYAVSGLVHSLGNTIRHVGLPLALIAVIGLQYACRRALRSLAILLCAGAIIVLIDVGTPYRTLLERQFPLLDSVHPASIQLAVLAPPPRVSNSPAPPWSRLPDITGIKIPLRVSGIAQNSVVAEQAMLVSVQGPSNFEWHTNWTPQWLELWPDSTSSAVQFTLKRSVYDQIKSSPVRLRLTLALSQYTESSSRQIVLPQGPFPVFGDGYCWQPGSGYFPTLTCHTPVYRPGFIASAVVNASCSEENLDSATQAGQSAHQFFPNGGSAGGLDPVQTFSIALQPPAETWQPPLPHLCPGTTLHLATPVPAGQWRITVEADQIKLEDSALDARSGPAAYGISSLSPLH